MDIQNIDGFEYLETIPKNTIDLILTDPPYITSSETGMGNLHKSIKENQEKGIQYVKTEEEWITYKEQKGLANDDKKENYLKYGTIYGSKYSVQTEYGDWDKDFTMELLDRFIGEYYQKLKKGRP